VQIGIDVVYSWCGNVTPTYFSWAGICEGARKHMDEISLWTEFLVLEGALSKPKRGSRAMILKAWKERAVGEVLDAAEKICDGSASRTGLLCTATNKSGAIQSRVLHSWVQRHLAPRRGSIH
jgi:hypothetical protein